MVAEDGAESVGTAGALKAYAKVLSGEISESEGQRRVLGAREIGIEGGKAGPGRGHKTAGNTKRFNGMDREYILAQLDRDGHAKLAAEVTKTNRCALPRRPSSPRRRALARRSLRLR